MFIFKIIVGQDSSGAGLPVVAAVCEYDNEHFGSVKGGECLD